MDHLQCIREGDGIQGRIETPVAVVDTGGTRETDEVHGRRDFGGGKRSSATGIRQADIIHGQVVSNTHTYKHLSLHFKM